MADTPVFPSAISHRDVQARLAAVYRLLLDAGRRSGLPQSDASTSMPDSEPEEQQEGGAS